MDEPEYDLGLGEVFTKSPSPPPPAPTHVEYYRPEHPFRKAEDWEKLSIRLVGSHPLWGHYLWNAARCFASYLDMHADELCKGKTVLELGAGGGLPGLVTALCGAHKVLLTDYPDEELVENMRLNVEANIPSTMHGVVDVQGYIWGRPVSCLLQSFSEFKKDGVDLILMSDLIFNHSQHDALLDTAESCLSSSTTMSCVLVFYTHHRPHLAARDLEFFTKARSRGWICEEIVTDQLEPMFPQDLGDVAVRSVVHGWRLTRSWIDR